jgi:RNA 3'-terminal phosphate cyclase (ATP)
MSISSRFPTPNGAARAFFDKLLGMRLPMWCIDGSQGEGGGQILRTALALSLCLQQPVELFNIRARRAQPGLGFQHVAAVRAAVAVGDADCEGAERGAQRLRFVPRGLRCGDFRFDIGTAGSAMLVLQTVLPALLHGREPSVVEIVGGTHNPQAPPFEYLQQVFFPLLERMGATVRASLRRAGYFPRGGGCVQLRVEPPHAWRPLHLIERGTLRRVAVTAAVAGLPRHIAEREVATVTDCLAPLSVESRVVQQPHSWGPGNAVFLTLASDNITEGFCGIGRKGVPAEAVAADVASQARDYLSADAAVGCHLADQLLLPMVLGGGGAFVTAQVSSHTSTSQSLIESLVGPCIRSSTTAQGYRRFDVCALS